jgi:hypothetical protein
MAKQKLTNEADKRITAREMPMDRPVERYEVAAEQPEIVVMNGNFGNYADELAFNEQIIEVEISPTTDKNEPTIVYSAVNGVPQHFVRGKRQLVKRKFVEALMTKEDAVSTPAQKDFEGANTYGIEHSEGFHYPIVIHNDPAGEKGRQWWERLTSR